MMGLQRVCALNSPSSKEDALIMKFKSSHAINQRIEQITMDHLVVGIDIAKETHVAGAVNFRGIGLGPTLSFNNDRYGFEKLIRWVQDLQKIHSLSQVIFGVESTGHYSLNLAYWLHERGDRIVLVNALTIKRNKENRDNKPSKNDAKDAIVIADTVSRGYYSDWFIPEAIYSKVRCLVNEREALSCDLTALGNQLQTAIDHVFPEFTAVFKDWKCPRAFATLKSFVLPADLKLLSIVEVIDGWREGGMKRPGGSLGRQAASSLLAAARRSVGLTDTAQEMKRQIGRLVERYESTQAYMETIDQELHEYLLQVPDLP
jgi:transposase